MEQALLVICPFWGVSYPPIGIAYISAYLRSKGISAQAMDINIDIYNEIEEEYKKFWDLKTTFEWKRNNFFEPHIQKYADIILKGKTRIIAFAVMASNKDFTVRLIEEIKKRSPKKIIITGGLEAHDNRNIDYHIKGEAERPLYELISAILRNDLQKLDSYRKREIACRPGDINELPFPTYEEFDLKKYARRELGLLMSRGCINKCIFCNDWPVRKSYQARKAEKVIEEIRYHVEKNKVNQFECFDLLTNGNIRELEKLCDMIIEFGLDIKWGGNAIIRKEMTPALLGKMKHAGCVSLTYGVETGSDNTINIIGKKFTAKEAEQVIRDTHDAGITVALNLMVGVPGETEEDFKKTLEFVKKNHKYIDIMSSVATFFVLNNMRIYDEATKFGINTKMNNYFYKWEDNKGSNYDLRMSRVRKLVSLLKELKIPVMELKAVEETEKEETKYDRKATTLFFECLREHGIMYTIKHTVTYLKKWKKH